MAATVLAIAGGVALAVNKTCLGTTGPSGSLTPDCVGTRGADTLTAGGGFHDKIYGDEGNDRINVQDGQNGMDTVNCGPGTKDRVFFDRGIDTISRNCEKRNPGQ